MNHETIDNCRGYQPRYKVWFICLLINLTEIEFDNVCGALYKTIKVRVSDLDVRNQVANCRLNLAVLK